MASGGRRHHNQLSQAFYTQDNGGVRLAVRVTPRARRSEVTGPVDTARGGRALAIKLAAPPADGAANEALIDLLAGDLGLAQSALRIVSGEKSRLKLVRISDCPLESVAAWASRWTGRSGAPVLDLGVGATLCAPPVNLMRGDRSSAG